MKSLPVMDPLDRIQVAGDSTYVTMLECCTRGYEVAMCTPDDLARGAQSYCRATPVRVTAKAPFFHPQDPQVCSLADYDVVWMRKDPLFPYGLYLYDLLVRYGEHPRRKWRRGTKAI